MKKILNFILSFIQPRKMIRYRNLNLIIVVLIFLGCTILCSEVSNLTVDNYVKRNKENFRLFGEVYDLEYDGEVKLPKFTINNETGTISSFTIGEEADNIYDFTFNLEENKKLNLTLVYEPNVKVLDDEKTEVNEQLLAFDLNGYYQHEPKRDADGNLLEKDMLVIITNELVYYIFNHGYDLNKDADGNYNRYLESVGWSIMENTFVLPKDATEIEYLDDESKEVNTALWTKVATRGEKTEIGGKVYYASDTGKTAYYLPANNEEATKLNQYGDVDVTNWTKLATSSDEQVVINSEVYSAKTKIKANIHEVFVDNSSTRVGIFSLYQVENAGIHLGNLDDTKTTVNPKLVVEAVANLMVSIGGSQLQNYNLFYSLIFIIFMPILFTFATWVMAKKWGELTRFKEYYAICSISYIPTTFVVAMLAAFLIPYAFIAQYAMFAQIGFFIFCVYRINSINRKNLNKDNNLPIKEAKHEEVIDLSVDPTPINENVPKAAKME